MTVYIMGKAQPPELSARLKESVQAARQAQAFSDGVHIDARSYRRVMQMAEDLLLIAHSMVETGNHPEAEPAQRWLAAVAAACRLRVDENRRQRLCVVSEGLRLSRGRVR